MNNKKLISLIICIHIIMGFLLVHKQSKITKNLYELQALQEEKDAIEQQHKELNLTLHKLTQLSTIEQHAQKNLNLQPMTLKDIKAISMSPEAKDVDGQSSK